MAALSYVVASTPRSGTSYMAALLTRLGLGCGHERYFTPYGAQLADEARTLFGDASWLAVPHLKHLPRRVVVLHQLRDPLRAINSIVHTGHLSTDDRRAAPFARFVSLHVTGAGATAGDPLRAIAFWAQWHSAIERASAGRTYIRYRLEDLSVPLVQRLVTAIAGREPGEAAVADALANTPRDTNRRGAPAEVVTGADLAPEIRAMVERYGYSVPLAR